MYESLNAPFVLLTVLCLRERYFLVIQKNKIKFYLIVIKKREKNF